MSEREKLLKTLSEQQFAAWDTGLFLDTHPADREALTARRGYMTAAEEAKKEYNRRFGMLTHACPEDGDRWQWVCQPWPWEND